MNYKDIFAIFLFLSAPLAFAQDPAQPAESEPLSEAEKLVWRDNQLGNIAKAGKLIYAFKKEGALETGFSDSIELTISEVKPDGMKNAALRVFSGPRERRIEPNPNTNANPIAEVFLERDIHEMERVTDGKWPFFQSKIKKALARQAEIKDVEIEFKGKKLKGKQIRITPFVGDPKSALMGVYAKKRYEFQFSDEIPGNLYLIRSEVPAESKDGKAAPKSAMAETLSLKSAE
jgi:hypothetical protein